MKGLLLESYLQLLQIELVLAFHGLHGLHTKVRNRRVSSDYRGPKLTVDVLCTAMEVGCVFYPKRVLCLQRSAATVLLLRQYGIDAQLAIGAQVLPFKSHAWVEVDGKVVNDKPYISEFYLVLERC
jgi:hypothetical protein